MNKLDKVFSISEIYKKHFSLVEKTIIVFGWVRSLRVSKNKLFVTINDGSCLNHLQIVFSNCSKQREEKFRDLQEEQTVFGSFIKVKGEIISTPERKDLFEMQGVEILDISKPKKNYPLQKKEMSLPFLRENSHLRSKTKYFLSVFKIRSELNKIINDFFWKEGFFYVNTPIITTNDAEGGGESFNVEANSKNFFGKAANLSVSGQLHEESLAQGMGKVYNFSPCFRAEKSNTSRHLSEFWMIEAEILSCEIKQLIKTIEDLIKFIFRKVSKTCREELIYLENYHSKSIISKLESFCKKKIPVITYKKCLSIINSKTEKELNFFEFGKVEWGFDLKSEHEKYLCEYFKSPLFVIDYPIETKAFYAKINDDKKTVAAVDLIFPQIGEIVGGGVRESDIESMEARINSEKTRSELDWYFKIRDYGYSGSAGFGMGFERLIMLITQSENIRDVIHFHRSSKELNF